MLYTEVVKDFADGLVDDIINRFGLVIEGGYRWQQMGSHLSRHGHQPKVTDMQRCFSDHQCQFAFFF